MSEPFRKENDCGCVETWIPLEGCDGTKSYEYHLMKCPDHWQKFVTAQEAMIRSLKDIERRSL